jgi:RimJ/RimL family protein N-acetyltransferase
VAGKLILETPRLLLREFDADDAEAFYPLGTDPQVTRFDTERLHSVEHAREILLAHPIADYSKHGYGRWACVLKETCQLIGFVGLKYLDSLKAVDVGYRLLPAYWNRGLATEAARASLDWGFATLGLGRIIGLVNPENVASVRVLQKLGMACTGTAEFRGETLARYCVDRPPNRAEA